MNTQQLTAAALDIGEIMLRNGAEIYRVEDTITRICSAYSAIRVDVFAITSHIILTVQLEEEAPFTQTRLVSRYSTPNLDYLNRLNEFSRYVCRNTPNVTTFFGKLKQIPKKNYPLFVKCIANSMIAASFTFFAGGLPLDALISALIATLLGIVSHPLSGMSSNRVFTTFCSAVFCGILASVFVKAGLPINIDRVVMGDIMILVPGLAFTTSLRDIINGDIISGLMRFSETLFITLSLATGFALALLLFGL